MKINIILLNGPRQSGKDYFCTYLHTIASPNPHNLYNIKFSKPIYDFLASVYNITAADILQYKDMPCPKTHNKTIREVMIHFSENFIKKYHGKLFFSERCVTHTLELIKLAKSFGTPELTLTVTDCGFQNEVSNYVSKIKKLIPDINFYLVRLYGKNDFSGDSRNYVSLNRIPTTEITNTYDEYFEQEINTFIKERNIKL